MKVKVAFEDDIRRWHYPEEERYANLLSFVEKSFNLPSKHGISLHHISNEQDLLSAFECAEQEKWSSLKIFVQIGVASSVSEVFSFFFPLLPCCVSWICFLIKNQMTKRKELNVKNRKQSQRNVIVCNDKKIEKKHFVIFFLELLSVENIKQLLPEFVARICSSLHRQVSDEEEVSLVAVVPKVLKERQFERIVQHQLYQQHIADELPTWLSQASFFTYTLLALSCDEI
ncbi:hypothetical protein RFI_06198 [Reticulomyxa filosa]|uniref:Uncharacterized protein n=1 Tax=Reticulomyxa filosa TaxID=46433 RepID=X6NYH6_RETFI|nr:hypothetical protein RFI_06198 [Reticulomyxa filosa]|eukprot:ETO30923.1 hypothetical protein RFI_06198 [Reticulomyxa filosa]